MRPWIPIFSILLMLMTSRTYATPDMGPIIIDGEGIAIGLSTLAHLPYIIPTVGVVKTWDDSSIYWPKMSIIFGTIYLALDTSILIYAIDNSATRLATTQGIIMAAELLTVSLSIYKLVRCSKAKDEPPKAGFESLSVVPYKDGASIFASFRF